MLFPGYRQAVRELQTLMFPTHTHLSFCYTMVCYLVTHALCQPYMLLSNSDTVS